MLAVMVMNEEEERFMESGMWLKEALEERLSKPLDQMQPEDMDDLNPVFDMEFRKEVARRLVEDGGRTQEEVELTMRLGVLLSLAFASWFKQE
ncbi:MAG: hypothetical protein HQL54_05950 [Magnetococcales bacterium]|nr:hypothetical protein [Magnetococcales bacterium]